MAIVRGAFSQLFTPGLRQALFARLEEDDYIRERERQDEMALVHPDTSAIPIWRRRPTRVEHPMTGWRAWGLDLEIQDEMVCDKTNMKIDAYLCSVAADCRWEGPVLRAHKRPYDPKYWDALRDPTKERYQQVREYYIEMRDTIELAGVWSVKTQEAAREVARSYRVPVYGRIKMWGRVAQFRDGYRAEVCMIDELWVNNRYLWAQFNGANDVRHDAGIKRKINQIGTALENRYQCRVTLA